MATDHDVFLSQVLPHVDTGIITEAQKSITELTWDDSDSVDLDTDAHSTAAYSFPTARNESTSSLSHTGRSGGLSPPGRRRPVTFANFDSHSAEQMADGTEGSEVGVAKLGNGHARRNSDVRDLDRTELPHQLPGHVPQPFQSSSVSMTPRQGPEPGAHQHSTVDVPVRQSSKVGRYINSAGFTHPPQAVAAAYSPGLDGTEPDRLRDPVVIQDDDNVKERDDGGQGDMTPAQYKAPSRYRPEKSSSTPPPIRNARPSRVLMYDSFEEDGDFDDDMDNQGYESPDSQPTARHRTVAPIDEDQRKPPRSSRNNERRLNSLNSESMRNPKSGATGSSMRGAHGPHYRTAALTMNYHSARTPMLDHVQLYHDAEPKRPLNDRAPESHNSLRQPYQQARTYRSIDDAMHTGYSAGISAGALEELAPRMPLRRPYSDDEISVRQQSISGKTAASITSQSALPDFFSAGIFNVVLHNPTTAHRLLKFSETRLCSENVEFLSKVDEYRTTVNNLASQMAAIHKTFISPGSHSQINVNGALLRQTHKEMKSLINKAFPSMENVFTDLQEQIETLVFQDIYPRFVRHQMALSATRALGSDRFKYQGLGDCFTLTDPKYVHNVAAG